MEGLAIFLLLWVLLIVGPFIWMATVGFLCMLVSEGFGLFDRIVTKFERRKRKY